MGQHFFYPPNNGSVPGTISANQGSPNTDANAWPVRITDGTHDATVTAGGALNVAIASGLSNPLPVTDAAAEASLASIDSKLTNPLPVSGPLTDTQLRATPVPVSISSGITNPLPVQDSASEASLASIDSKLNSLGQKLMAGSMPVVVASDQSAIPVTISGGLANPLPVHDAAFSNKTASSPVTVPFDERVISYVGATQRIDTVIYKLAGVTVATQTLNYDGSDRLTGDTVT